MMMMNIGNGFITISPPLQLHLLPVLTSCLVNNVTIQRHRIFVHSGLLSCIHKRDRHSFIRRDIRLKVNEYNMRDHPAKQAGSRRSTWRRT